jgi:DNA polymerase V
MRNQEIIELILIIFLNLCNLFIMAAVDRFEQKLKNLSNHKLYKLAVKYFLDEYTGFERNSHRLDLIYDECQSRYPKIFKDALKDSIITINSMEEDLEGMKVVRIQRIDYMDDLELYQFLQTAGAAIAHPIIDDGSVTSTSLNEILGIKKENLFACTVSGISMKEAGIIEGDVLIVDTETEPIDQDIIIAAVNGNLFVKKIMYNNSQIWLHSENDEFKPVLITPQMNFNVFGVVMHKMTPMNKRLRRK